MLKKIAKNESLLPFFGSIVLVLLAATILPGFLSFTYLMQQLQITSFLGILVLGATPVILLGHIDLSIPWVFTGSAIIATAITGLEDGFISLFGVPLALLFGAIIGLCNGIGVTVLRIPSMVWTLAINSMLFGLAVLFTGGYNPKGYASEVMSFLSKKFILGVPVSFLIWFILGLGLWFSMEKTPLGRYIRAIGYAEKATYLAGISNTTVVMLVFVIAGMCSAFGGVLLAGYADQAYQSMGDPFLMPAIAAVVIGGTSILGGKGSLSGGAGGALFITLLTSVLSVMQINEAWRQIIFGSIIIAMLFIHRGSQSRVV